MSMTLYFALLAAIYAAPHSSRPIGVMLSVMSLVAALVGLIFQ